jgi:hypothetical protein
MPWVKKESRPHNPYSIAALIAVSAVCVGILIGYTRWGATAAIVSLVEKELAETEAHIQVLEKRLTAIESIIIGNKPVDGAAEDGTGEIKKSEGKANP